MVADKGKKPKVGEKIENGADQIDAELVQSIEKLLEVQDELEKINEEASDKVLEIEQKYNEVRKPVYDKRNDIIKSIPKFWLITFLKHPALSDLLNEEDHKIFKHLTSLEVEDMKDVSSGYSITFNFSPNPYFEDTKLTKTITFLDEGTTKNTAASIKWKEGMGLSNGLTHEKNGKKRPHEEDSFSLMLASFFSWFIGTQRKDIEEILDGVAEMIKEDLWVNPHTYYNSGEDVWIVDEDCEEDIGTDDSDEDEEDEDEDDDSDEDEDEDDDQEN